MVPVNTTADFLLADARATLKLLMERRPQSDLAIVFGSWISFIPAKNSEVETIITAAAQRSGAQQDFQTVATLGFALHGRLLDVGSRAALKQGLDRLAGRQAFVDEVPMPFCSDAIGLLGVAVGTSELADTSVSSKINAWLAGFLKKICEMGGTEDWQRCLFHAADHVLGQEIGLSSSISDEAADVRVALRSKGILPPADAQAAEQEEGKTLRLLRVTAPTSFLTNARR